MIAQFMFAQLMFAQIMIAQLLFAQLMIAQTLKLLKQLLHRHTTSHNLPHLHIYGHSSCNPLILGEGMGPLMTSVTHA